VLDTYIKTYMETIVEVDLDAILIKIFLGHVS